MSAHIIYYENRAKHMRPISSAEEYHKLRGSAKQAATLKAAREGDKKAKRSLLQFNYSCLPNDDGTLKGSVRLSTSVGMDVDMPTTSSPETLERIKTAILEKKEELGLMMLERSVSKGYHLVFKRHTDMSQEENLHWASTLLGIPFDEAAKDHTRVFFTTSDSPEDLLFLSDELFEVGGCEVGGSEVKGGKGCEVKGLEVGGSEVGGSEVGGSEVGGLEVGGLEVGGCEVKGVKGDIQTTNTQHPTPNT